jgi:conjugal transfer pilus assembly protein TraF
MNTYFKILTFFILSSQVLKAEDFYKKHGEGWFWYQDPKFEEEAKEPEPKPDAPKRVSPPTIEERARARVEKVKKDLEEAKFVALEFPSEENTEKYMRLQKEMMDKANTFSKVWQQVVLKNPDLNPEVRNPTAQYVRSTLYAEKDREKMTKIKALSKSHGLIYFFKKGCPFCTQFAPIVQMFAQKYNWSVMAVSVDGSASEQFPNAMPDNGIVTALNIQNVPALIAFNAETNSLLPISYAAASLEQLENNIMALIGDKQ